MLQRTIYASRSLIGGWGPDLLDIARAAFARNPGLGVTGVLYFDRLRFLQVLEGPPDSLAALMRSIRADSRHFDLRVLAQGPAGERAFARWSMRFVDGDAEPPLRDAFPPDAPGLGARAEAERFAATLAALG